LAVEDIDHSRTKTKSPQTNGICERFHKTVLNEFYRIAFRKKLYASIEDLQNDLDLWVRSYNEERPHQGRWCFGKEYVASQAPDNPGVLVLSQFAGAAQELKSALIVNPYDIEATAAAIARAYAMPLEERKDRWNALMAVLRANSIHDWASHFLQALANEAESGEF